MDVINELNSYNVSFSLPLASISCEQLLVWGFCKSQKHARYTVLLSYCTRVTCQGRPQASPLAKKRVERSLS
jgi:hypothetical protein